MNKNNYFKKILICILIWSITLMSGFLLGINIDKVDNDTSINKLIEVKNILKEDWYFADQFNDIDETLINNALYGMSNNSIDIHTTYMNEEQRLSFTDNTNHHFVGIGIEYINIDTYKIVTNVFSDSPANRAGILPGDFIYKVDGHEVANLDNEQMKQLTLGEVNSQVVVDVIRDNKQIPIEIYRGDIGSVYGEIISDVGYIEIMSFGEDTATQLENLINDFISQDIDSYIIDLRNNGGGYLNSLIDISGLFIPNNTIVMHQVFSDETIDIFKTKREPLEGIKEVVILINEGTASASEAFTLAMKENFDNTTTVGVESYGKGTMQQTRTFDDGSALKYTTGRWQSSKGHSLIESGIIPDYEIDEKNIVNSPYLFNKDETYELDKYHYSIIDVQNSLRYLGYKIEDQEGHFSKDTLKALNEFQKENNYKETNYINQQIYMNIRSKLYNVTHKDHYKDSYFKKAMDIINE